MPGGCGSARAEPEQQAEHRRQQQRTAEQPGPAAHPTRCDRHHGRLFGFVAAFVIGQRRASARVMRHFQHEPVLAIEHHLVASLQPAVADGNAVDPGAIGTAQVTQQYPLAVYFHPRVLFGEGRLIDLNVDIAATADHPRARQRVAAAVMQATDTAQQALLVTVAFNAGGRRRCLQQGVDLALQDHFHAVHVYRVTRPQQGHAPYRATIHMDAANTVADLQPEAAVVHAELGEQQRAVAGITEAHAAVCLAHDALHPGPQRLVGLLLLTEVN
uniref:Uncharacterized protein n=1 Tax=Knufia peltigerae TaxID=1002370 RepID=A0AA38Y217_9EURO|nr:hypothetical protein H2204_007275 [Knufia peltigerae]